MGYITKSWAIYLARSKPDYEYANYYHVTYNIAYHFSEMTIDYHSKDTTYLMVTNLRDEVTFGLINTKLKEFHDLQMFDAKQAMRQIVNENDLHLLEANMGALSMRLRVLSALLAVVMRTNRSVAGL
ncbi:hypothetical protein ACFE04_019958 [Oxalis oulophora]